MKVYHILDHYIPIYTGYTFRTRYILDFQKKSGIDARAIISPKNSQGLKSRETLYGIECFRSQTNSNGFMGKLPLLKEMNLMNRLKKDILKTVKSEPDTILHAHSPVLCGLPAYQAGRKLRIPVIYEIRAFWEDAAVDREKTKRESLRYYLTRKCETDLLKNVDRVITICEGLKREVELRGVEADKIDVIPNGVDITHFVPVNKNPGLIRKFGLEDKISIGFIGSFYKFEGLSTIIKAMPEILAKRKNAVLFLVGSGEQEQSLKELAGQMGLNNSVIFTGQVPHNEILDYYSIIDILVYPREKSRLTDIVTPLKPLEAMAMEKPVIGSDVGGIKELVRDGESGLLFKADDIRDLADKCLRLMENSAACRDLGIKARKYVARERDWGKIVSKHTEIYQKVLKENGR